MTELADIDSEAVEPTFDDPDPVAYNAFMDRMRLSQIEVARILAERVTSGDSVETNFETRLGFLVGESTLHWRFDCDANVLDAEGETLGVIEVAVVVTTEIEDGEPPTPEMMARFGNTSAVLMAHPYLRETIATAAQRIGLPNVVLPMVRR